jgi:hypothetical protein
MSPAAFAWPNSGLLCGQCHFLMHCEVSKNDIPVEFRAQCQNPACPNYMKLFRVPPVSAIQLEEIVELRGVKLG